MQYMLLIYNDEAQGAAASEEERGAMMQAYMAYTGELRAAEAMVAGDPLQPSSTATLVRVRNGQRQTEDAAINDGGEQLGGYYMVECDNLDQAIEWAAKIPGAQSGTIEVRPVLTFG